jgi:hypothetical protein
MDERVLDFFKTMIDANRLRMAALLLDESLTPEEIAARLHLRLADVVRQLGQIEKLGLLVQDGERYRVDSRAMEGLSREVLAGLRPVVAAHSDDQNADEFDRKVVKNYSLPDGRLREIPMQERKFAAVLRHVVQGFEPGTRYTEKQVNELLARYNADFATLRRGLIDHKLIQREQNGSVYWRPV